MRLVLILSASIEVADPAFLRPEGRGDTATRLGDYRAALEAWLTRQHSLRELVFVDNSGHPLDALRELAARHPGKRVEWISCRTEGYSKARGRSYGELDLLRQAWQKSELLRGASHVAKVNGRLFVRNIDRLCRALPEDFDAVGSLQHNLTWLATTFFLARPKLLFERLLPRAIERVDDTRRLYIERVLAQELLRAIADDRRWYPFPCEPDIEGVCAHDNRPYPGGWLRGRLIDLFAWGYHRARDVSFRRGQAHPQARWRVDGGTG